MNLKKSKSYVIFIALILIFTSGFSQSFSCYQEYKGQVDFNCEKLTLSRKNSSNSMVEVIDNIFYKLYPNLIKIYDLDECLSFIHADAFKIDSDSMLVVVPNSLNPVIIKGAKDSIVIPVKLMPQVKVEMAYKNRVITAKDTIPIGYFNTPGFFSVILNVNSKIDSCINKYINNTYVIPQIEVSHIRKKKIKSVSKGDKVSDIISCLKEKIKSRDILLIKVVVEINNQYSENRLFRILVM